MTEDQELDLVERLAEEFTERFRRGERPSIEEYAERYPQQAAIIRDTFQALALMENLAPLSGGSCGEASPSAKPAGGAARPDYLGDYRIVREVGRGGMGIVYEAEQVSLGRHVAVKVLPKELLENPKHGARFEREARAAAKLHHTNIVPVFGVGEESGLGYYVMQFIQGLALDKVLDELKRMKPRPGTSGIALEVGEPSARHRDLSAADVARSLMTGNFDPLDGKADSGSRQECPIDATLDHQPDDAAACSTATARLSDTWSGSNPAVILPGGSSGTEKKSRRWTYWQSVAQIGVQVGEALEYAHGQGVLHRDIKPSNLLLDLRGTVWVTDFGLAKLDDDRGLTQAGDILGTLRYMAPETLRQQSDARSEVYSLGLTLYELLALRPAFEAPHRHALLDQVLNGRIEPLEKRNPEIPRDLATIVHKAIEREPRHRYQRAQELADDLRRFIDDEPVQARRLSTFEHVVRWSRRNRGLAASLATVAVLLLTINIAGPIYTWRMARLNDDLQTSKTSLSRTVGQLTQTSENLAKARNKAEKVAAENLRLANVAQENLRKAQAAEQEARGAEKEGRHLQYTTDMRLAPFVWQDEEATAEQLRTLLARHEPEVAPAFRDGSDNRSPLATGDSTSHRVGATKEDLRSFEWYYYKHLLENSARVFRGHEARVIGAALAADEQLITFDDNAQIRCWNIEMRAEDNAGRRELGQGRNVRASALASDGRLAAIAADARVYLFDVATGKELFQFDSTDLPLRRLTFSGDGHWLVILDDKLRWCDTRQGTVLAGFNKQFTRVAALALSAEGQTLAVAGHGPNGTLISIFRFDASTNTVTEAAKDIAHNGAIGVAAVAPGGSLLVTSCVFNGIMHAFDVPTGQLVGSKLWAHASPISAMKFSADGSELAVGDWDGTIRIWRNIRNLRPESAAHRTFKGHLGAITGLGFSADSRKLLSTSADRTARDLGAQEADVGARRVASAGASLLARFSPDGLLIALAEINRVRLFDAETGQPVREFSIGDGSLAASVAFSPDNRHLAVGHCGNRGASYVSLWDIDSGKLLARLPGSADVAGFPQAENFASGVVAVAFSPDGQYLLAAFGAPYMFRSAHFSCPLKVWQVATRRLIHRLIGHQGLCTTIAFSPRGDLLASGSQDGTAIVWSTETWKAVRTLENPGRTNRTVADVAFSPDGKTLAMASREGSVVLWDLATGDRKATLARNSSGVIAVAFSPQGGTLASGGDDAKIRLWNVGTQRELVAFDSERVEVGSVQSLAFSPDGSHLLAAGKRVALWSAAPLLWDEPERAAKSLKLLLDSGADFPSRIRMFSEHLRLHEALERIDSGDPRVAAALAATRANWHAARANRGIREYSGGNLPQPPDFSGSQLQHWKSAVEQYELLKQLSPVAPDAWLRTPGLLRLAAALFHQHQPAEAAALLTGGETRRTLDDATHLLIEEFRAAVNQKLGESPGDPALLELRGELAGQLSEYEPQIADYTAAIEAWQLPWPQEAVGDGLKRLYRRRGDAYLAIHKPQLALEDYARGLTENATKEELSKRAVAYELLPDWNAAAADWAQTAEGNPRAAALLAEFARRLSRNGQPALAASHFERSRRLYEDQLRAGPANAEAAEALANLLFDAQCLDEKWTVLEPVDVPSLLGRPFTLQADGSLLTGGERMRLDSYTVTYRCRSGPIAALRLEALPHVTLPGSGPGCGANGNFRLTELHALLRRTGKAELPLMFSERITDETSQAGSGTHGQISWSIWPGDGGPHELILVPSEPVQVADDDQIALQLDFSDPLRPWARLGRFRLSVADPATLRCSRLAAARKIDNPWLRLAAAYALRGETVQAAKRFAVALEDAEGFVARRAIIELLSRYEGVFDLLEQAHSDDPALRSAQAANHVKRGVGLLTTRPAEAQAEFDQSCRIYTQLFAEFRTDAATTALLHNEYAALGEWYAAAGQWPRAIDGCRAAITLKPDDWRAWLRAAAVVALAGDEAAYREFCRDMVRQFRDTNDAGDVERTCKACLLLPDAIDISELPIKRLREATEASPAGFPWWAQASAALAAYREGHAQDAIALANQVGDSNVQPHALALVVCAMAEHQLGQVEQARQTLAQASALMPAELRTLGTDSHRGPLPVAEASVSHDWLIPEILRREAATLLSK